MPLPFKTGDCWCKKGKEIKGTGPWFKTKGPVLFYKSFQRQY